MRLDLDAVFGRIGHVGQVQSGNEVGAVEVIARGGLEERAGEIAKLQIPLMIAAQVELGRIGSGMQKDDDRDDALGVEQEILEILVVAHRRVVVLGFIEDAFQNPWRC
ncbi:hypothetical protein Thiowin_04505 [Thiorhodovibrio winogradskyi]|uniref:Uncharacterized protein n=2 Tax=Thiorhodovibrio winogradskyi TaxID=77007 RepID=A0ABZ0SFU1_9GAMM